MNTFAQVTQRTIQAHLVKSIRLSIRSIRHTTDFGLQYFPLNIDSLHIRCYADAALAGSKDLSSHIELVIVLADKINNCDILIYHSRESFRVDRSVMGAVAYAFVEGFCRSILLANKL